MSLKGLSDDAIERLAEQLVAEMNAQWLYNLLSWSDHDAAPPQRRLLRDAMARRGFAPKAVALFRTRATNPQHEYWLRVFMVFGETLEDRKTLFLCPGLMEENVAVLADELNDGAIWFDALSLMWGFLEDRTVSAEHAHLALALLQGLDEEMYDSSQAAGCLALLCAADPATILAQEQTLLAMGMCVIEASLPMTAFYCAVGMCHLIGFDPSNKRLLDCVRIFVREEGLVALVAELQRIEAESLYRWISLEWATDLLCADKTEAVLVGLLGMTHLLQNSTNLPLLSHAVWENVVALQHHPSEAVRLLWRQLLPFFKTRPYEVPRLQRLVELQRAWRSEK